MRSRGNETLTKCYLYPSSVQLAFFSPVELLNSVIATSGNAT